MALIDITPVMTSNTTPSPYVVSASSTYSTYTGVWTIFDGVNSSTDTMTWASASTPTGWIKIDFGSIKKVDAFTMYRRKYIDPSDLTPKSFILYGSNDDIIYEQLLSVNNQILWTVGEGRLYKINSSVNYRYYRINIAEGNTGSIIGIGELKFWQDDGTTTSVINKNASLTYCLPSNTTQAMNQRQNDSREGLLGFANDSDNYGTLWMINNKGHAQIPIAGTKSDVLFDGNANIVNSTYNLSNSITKYKFLIFFGDSSTVDGNCIGMASTYIMIPNVNRIGHILYLGNTSAYSLINFKLNSESSFIVTYKGTTTYSPDIKVTKVIGVI
jgi:hypothetical protein